MQTTSKLQQLRILFWPDGPRKQLERLKGICPRLVINTSAAKKSTGRSGSTAEMNAGAPLDTEHAALVSQVEWPDPDTLPVETPGSTPKTCNTIKALVEFQGIKHHASLDRVSRYERQSADLLVSPREGQQASSGLRHCRLLKAERAHVYNSCC